MAFGDLTNKLELAAVALLAANPVAGITPYSGQSGETFTRPAVIAIAEQGDEFPQDTGNFNMELRLRVENNADSIDLPGHRALFAGVVDLFRDTAIAANLSAQQSDFFVLGIFNPRFNTDVQERVFISELILTVYCCATDL